MTKEELLNQADFTEEQVNKALWGFQDGLTVEQVAFLYKPEFTNRQMRQAVIGFKNGLSAEQVSIYYKPETHYLDMLIHRMKLEKENSR
jgi:hypothetical protein